MRTLCIFLSHRYSVIRFRHFQPQPHPALLKQGHLIYGWMVFGYRSSQAHKQRCHFRHASCWATHKVINQNFNTLQRAHCAVLSVSEQNWLQLLLFFRLLNLFVQFDIYLQSPTSEYAFTRRGISLGIVSTQTFQ
jgi:hypothetical protein